MLNIKVTNMKAQQIILFFTVIALSTQISVAQNCTIFGTLTDSINNTGVAYAHVAVANETDSTDANIQPENTNTVTRQPMPMSPSLSSPMPVGQRTGGGGPTTRVSVFDTASVGESHSVDFSRNLSQYRSPQKALFYSLLVPGLGQAYNKKYWRTGLYAAIEVGMITGAVYFRKDARRLQSYARDFADQNFDRQLLENFYSTLTKRGYEILSANDSITNVGASIFGFESPFWDDSTRYGYQEYLKEFDEDRYGDYGMGSLFAVQGWKDVVDYGYWPTNIDSMLVIVDGRNAYGYSDNQNHYLSTE
jgi:hypothetical protein